MHEDLPHRHEDYDHVEREVDRHEHHGDADRLPEAAQEHDREQSDEHERDDHLVAMKPTRGKGVFDGMSGGIRSGEGDGDHEVSGRETEQHQHEQLAGPPRQQPLEHRDRAGAAEALPSHPTVDRQRPEEGESHEHDGCEG